MVTHSTDSHPIDRLERARAYRQSGRYGEALRELEGCEDWAAPASAVGTLLKAHILVPQDPVHALELLAATQDLYQSSEERFGYLTASARAYINSRNFTAAAEMLEQAGKLGERVEPASRLLLWYLRALLRGCLQEYDPADPDVERLLASSLPNGKFLGFLRRSYMHAGLGNYAEQTSDLAACVRVASAHPGSCDLSLVALQIHALLRLGLEMGDQTALAAGTEAFDWMPWTDDLQEDRFLCLRALGWSAFLRGEPAQAQWFFKDSKTYAANDAWKAMAHADRAYVARMNGNEPWSTEELAAAHAIARTVDWAALRGEERQVLVMLAVLFAPTDMARAQHYVSLYLQLGKSTINPTLALANDRRAVAFEQYALGRVHQVLANDALAVRAFEEAYEIFSAARYRFRAALAAIGLFEISADPGWMERARNDLAIYPNSALFAHLSQQQSETMLPSLRQLTPMQRQIAYALCEGLDLAQLSERFSRSAFTIEHHVNAVYERLGVTNRNALRSVIASGSRV